MAETEMGERHEENIADYTMDGTVDIKGRPCLRSGGGRWPAALFIIFCEALERVTFYGVVSNLVLYLKNKLQQGTVEASNNVTNLFGTIMLTPILAAYVADSHLGRYWTNILSFAIYLLGVILLTLAVSLPSLRPLECSSLNGEGCKNPTNRAQVAIFFFALYIMAIGAGGTKSNMAPLGADQFDIFNPKERAQKLTFFNWWAFAVFCGNLLSSTVIIYIQDNISFSVGYITATIALAFSILIFLLGTTVYRHKLPSGSPFTRIAQVLTATIRKWKLPLSADSQKFYKINNSTSLRFFDRAAVKTDSDSPWMLCSAAKVEETKKIIKLLPVFATTIISTVSVVQVITLFVQQADTLNRTIGPRFKIPPASLSSFFICCSLISVAIYDKCFVPLMRKFTKNPRGVTLLQRIGVGQALQIFIMIMAALIERWRLSTVRDHGLVHQRTTVPLTILVLLPQFALMGVAQTLVEIGKMEFFYDQAPEGMKSIGASFYTSSLGIGSFMSGFLMSTVAKLTRRGGRGGWIEKNLNASHLDYYYAFLAVLVVINFVFFLIVSKFHAYNMEVVQVAESENRAVGEIMSDKYDV